MGNQSLPVWRVESLDPGLSFDEIPYRGHPSYREWCWINRQRARALVRTQERMGREVRAWFRSSAFPAWELRNP